MACVGFKPFLRNRNELFIALQVTTLSHALQGLRYILKLNPLSEVCALAKLPLSCGWTDPTVVENDAFVLSVWDEWLVQGSTLDRVLS